MRKKGLVVGLIISVIILISLFTLITIMFLTNKDGERKKEENATVVEIKDYGYLSKYNDSKVYQSYFNQLKLVLSADKINYDKYAELISKLFIMDFFTLKDKKTSSDIGGTEFIYDKFKDDFSLRAKNSIYAIVGNSIDDDLPVVKDVNVIKLNNIEKEYYNKLDKNAYDVYLKWQYEETNDYQSEAVITIVKENNKLSIVEMRNYE